MKLSPAAALSRYAIWLIIALSAGTALLAMRRTSTTFDEIIMMAAGARGFETGRFDLQPEHPPLPQYLYGLPVWLSGARYPTESGPTTAFAYRYEYSRAFFWMTGNNPERIAFLGRMMGVLCASLLVYAVYRYARRWGQGTALFAAVLVAFIPDLIAHAGVAYNDVPLALFYFLTLWATDRAAREPSWRTGALAGLCLALACSVKFSAIALGPVVVLIALAEAVTRRFERGWLRRAGLALGAGTLAAYLALVLIYRGDVALAEFRYGLDFTFRHVNEGHGAPGYLLGDLSAKGWWYFFPVAFLYKTPAALHVLMLLAAAAFIRSRTSLRNLLRSPLRAPLIATLVFAAALITSSLVIGFRYALPLLPPLCVITAVGAVRLWRQAKPALRIALVALPTLYVASTLSYYPFFLSYMSEYGPGKNRGDLVLLDSSLDWGQGLLALRDFMRERNIDRVYLSYFGSAMPEGYGIRYVALPSFFNLPQQGPKPAPPEAPKWLVISATNLHGVYMGGVDPFKQFRATQPDTVLAHSLFVYRMGT